MRPAIILTLLAAACSLPTDPESLLSGYDECSGRKVAFVTPEGYVPAPAAGECLRVHAPPGVVMTPLSATVLDVDDLGAACAIVKPPTPFRTWRRDSCNDGTELVAETVSCAATCYGVTVPSQPTAPGSSVK